MFEEIIEFRKVYSYSVYIIGYLGILIYYSGKVFEVFLCSWPSKELN